MRKILVLIGVVMTTAAIFAAGLAEVENLRSEPSVNGAVVEWAPINDPDVDKLEILIKDNNSGASFKKYKIADKSETKIDVKKLEPLGSYTFKIKLNYKDGKKSKGAETTVVVKHKNVIYDSLDGKTFFVYLPDGYEKENTAYPTLYMFDGQNLFTAAFTPSKWGIDDAIDKLTGEGKIEKMIAVGVFHAGDKRHEEYIPYFFETGKNYSEWFVKKLIPYIDSKYRTKADRDNRAVMGSSLGGLMTLYMLNNYSEYFSFGGAFSVHDPWKYEMDKEIPKKNITLWIDTGTGEYSSGSDNGLYSYTQAARSLVDSYISKGHKYGSDLYYYEVKDAIHNEMDWAKRVEYPIQLFKGKNKGDVKDIKVDIEAVKYKDGSYKYIANPVAVFESGVTYSLYSEAKYSAVGKGSINEKGEFTLGDSNTIEIKVSYGGINKSITVSKEMLETEEKKALK